MLEYILQAKDHRILEDTFLEIWFKYKQTFLQVKEEIEKRCEYKVLDIENVGNDLVLTVKNHPYDDSGAKIVYNDVLTNLKNPNAFLHIARNKVMSEEIKQYDLKRQEIVQKICEYLYNKSDAVIYDGKEYVILGVSFPRWEKLEFRACSKDCETFLFHPEEYNFKMEENRIIFTPIR